MEVKRLDPVVTKGIYKRVLTFNVVTLVSNRPKHIISPPGVIPMAIADQFMLVQIIYLICPENNHSTS